MTPSFSLKTLAVAIATLSVASLSNAAGLDRSGQDVTAFLEDGLYAEASYTYIDADVTGYDNATQDPQDLNKYTQGKKIDDIAESYDFARYGVKADVNDSISVGILYDEPFGAAAKYSGDNNFIDAKGEATNVEVRSQNITGLVGVKLGDNFKVYGGPAIQRLKGDVALRGTGYARANGYTAHISPDDAVGWVAGAAFLKPEIALKAALTYRSEIDHENSVDETFPLIGALPPQLQGAVDQIATKNGKGKLQVTTPESFNFDFQTGINPTTLATAKIRYVPWSDFTIVPPVYNAVSQLATQDGKGLPLVGYSDDQWQVELGLAKRLSPMVAVSGSIGWDSGAGNPTTSLGPIEGYYSIGAGAKFNLDKNWAISAGGKYLMFGDAKGSLPDKQVVSNFEDNNGYVLGVKLSYQEK